MQKPKRIASILMSLILVGFCYLFFAWALNNFGSSFSTNYSLEGVRIQLGDDLDWKDPNFEDADWEEDWPEGRGIYWWRLAIEIHKDADERKALGLGIRSFPGSYEVFWDGHYLGSNGRFGTNKELEKAGAIDRLFLLPEMLSDSGKHLLAVRVSRFHQSSFRAVPFIKLGEYDAQSRLLIIIAAFMHILAGIFLALGFYFLSVYFQSFRESSFLYFAALCLSIFIWIILEYVRFYYAYPYPFHYPRLEAIAWMAFGTNLLIPLYFWIYFRIAGIRWIFALSFSIQLFIGLRIGDYDLQGYYWNINCLVFSLAAVCIALFQKKENGFSALLSLIPLGISLGFFYPLFYDQVYFLSLSFFILMQVILMNQFLKNLRKEYESSLQRVHLLRIELLKKNLKPHFLMNTLTSLISWVEESPKVAIRFIEALANEFDRLSSVAEKDLIPLAEEIDLCKEHLNVMSFRNEISYKLEVEGSIEGEYIPPAILLTLIENGLSHNIIEAEEACFHLSIQAHEDAKTYRLSSPGKAIQQKEIETPGTGWKYIQARLEQNYPSAWKMESYGTSSAWINIIHLNSREP